MYYLIGLCGLIIYTAFAGLTARMFKSSSMGCFRRPFRNIRRAWVCAYVEKYPCDCKAILTVAIVLWPLAWVGGVVYYSIVNPLKYVFRATKGTERRIK